MQKLKKAEIGAAADIPSKAVQHSHHSTYDAQPRKGQGCQPTCDEMLGCQILVSNFIFGGLYLEREYNEASQTSPRVQTAQCTAYTSLGNARIFRRNLNVNVKESTMIP